MTDRKMLDELCDSLEGLALMKNDFAERYSDSLGRIRRKIEEAERSAKDGQSRL